VLYTEGARRGKAWEAFRDAHAGKTILNQREWDDTFATVDGIAAHAVTRALLSRVVATETTIRWTDPATSLECKGRADAILDDGSLVDLKGYGSDPHLVSRLVGKHGTHVQLAHYAAGLEAQGKTPPHVYVLSYDTKAPYDVCLAELAPDVRAFGAAERNRLMGVLAECLRSNHWPGRCPDIVPITLEDFPGYIRPELGADDETFTSDDEEIPA
jgi:exodeoxyribonuclease VIII